MKTAFPYPTSVLLGLLLLLGWAPGSAAAEMERLAELQQRMDRAYFSRDIVALEGARAEARAMSGAGDAGFIAGYLGALAGYRLGDLYDNDRDRASDALNQCIDDLSQLLAGRSGALAAEGFALLGGCYGSSTQFYRPPRMMLRGSRAQQNLEEALSSAPDNPRVVLQDALADYSRPPMVGGDVSRAVLKFERATALFAAADQPPVGYPAWGEPETWLNLGRANLKKGRREAARTAFQKALELVPEYRDAAEALAALQ